MGLPALLIKKWRSDETYTASLVRPGESGTDLQHLTEASGHSAFAGLAQPNVGQIDMHFPDYRAYDGIALLGDNLAGADFAFVPMDSIFRNGHFVGMATRYMNGNSDNVYFIGGLGDWYAADADSSVTHDSTAQRLVLKTVDGSPGWPDADARAWLDLTNIESGKRYLLKVATLSNGLPQFVYAVTLEAYDRSTGQIVASVSTNTGSSLALFFTATSPEMSLRLKIQSATDEGGIPIVNEWRADNVNVLEAFQIPTTHVSPVWLHTNYPNSSANRPDWTLHVANAPTTFRLHGAIPFSAADLTDLPDLEEDWDGGTIEVATEPQINGAGDVIGRVLSYTKRLIRIAPGQLTPDELQNYRPTVEALVSEAQPCFFFPDKEALTDALFCFPETNEFSAPMVNGLHATTPIILASRVPVA